MVLSTEMGGAMLGTELWSGQWSGQGDGTLAYTALLHQGQFHTSSASCFIKSKVSLDNIIIPLLKEKKKLKNIVLYVL